MFSQADPDVERVMVRGDARLEIVSGLGSLGTSQLVCCVLVEFKMSDPWECRLCATTVEADYDVCWQCGADRDGNPDQGFESYEQAYELYEYQIADPSSLWTGKALKVAGASFFGVLLFAFVGSFFIPSLESDEALGPLALIFFVLSAGSAAICFGSLCAFVILCFLPLRAVHKTLPQEKTNCETES
jgi:hypothetical protein